MEKARDKTQRRVEAKERKAQDAELRSGLDIDPDIAGMTPGPQAVPDEWAPFMPDEEELKAEKEKAEEAEAAKATEAGQTAQAEQAVEG